MALHRQLGDVELRRDLAVARAPGDELEHLALARGEHRSLLTGALAVGDLVDLLDEHAREVAPEGRLSAQRSADRAQQPVGRGLLAEVADRPRADRREHRRRGRLEAPDHGAHRADVERAAERREGAVRRQVEVDQHDVGSPLGHDPRELLGVGGLDELEIALAGEEGPHP